MKELVFGELITLKGQHCLRIPVEMGINSLCVEVFEGKIRINHGAYTPDGGTWLSAPAARKAHYDFSSGDKERIAIDIRESFRKQDMLSVVNVSLFHKAVFRINKNPPSSMDKFYRQAEQHLPSHKAFLLASSRRLPP